MAIQLTERYIKELRKGFNSPNVILELALDSGTVKFAFKTQGLVTAFIANGSWTAGATLFACGGDDLPGVVPVLKSVSSLQNKLDTRAGYSTRGQLTFTIAGRDNFRSIVRDEYLKNRRAVRKDGFLGPGFTHHDYASTFTGKVIDWARKGDELTLTIADDLKDASVKIPQENASKTQYIDYRDANPADIMLDILLNRIGADPLHVDSVNFALERDMWLQGWKFDRVLTEPLEANQYLNELQMESNSFVVHDGEKINYKVFSPPVPWKAVQEWTDGVILKDTFSVKGGYRDSFYNRVVVLYDYIESGNDRDEDFEAAVIAVDASSQDASQWSETSTRTIKSRWIRSRTYTYSGGLTGVRPYHVSRANGTGAGTLSYDSAAGRLTWASPVGLAGEAVAISQDGRYQVFDSDKRRYIRVLVTASELPAQSAVATVDIRALNGEACATALAAKILSRYRDPVATASFEVDINNIAEGTGFLKPTDLKDITTGEACGKGRDSWARNRLMLTSVRPDFSTHRVSIEAIETKMHRRYGFIAAAGFPDYAAATDPQRGYGFIGNTSNRVGPIPDDGYYIW